MIRHGFNFSWILILSSSLNSGSKLQRKYPSIISYLLQCTKLEISLVTWPRLKITEPYWPSYTCIFRRIQKANEQNMTKMKIFFVTQSDFKKGTMRFLSRVSRVFLAKEWNMFNAKKIESIYLLQKRFSFANQNLTFTQPIGEI